MCQLSTATHSILQLPRIAAALILIGFALDSAALTIGRPTGPVLIGRPLDVVIPITLDPSEPGESLCLEAEVVQGDSRIPDRRVTLSVDPGPSPSAPRVRIRSTVAIEEPIVNLNIRAGCATKSIRNYVLLADVAVESNAPAVAPPRASSELERPVSPSARPAQPSFGSAGAGGSSGFGTSEGTGSSPGRSSAGASDAEAAPRTTPPRPRRPAATTVTPRPAAPTRSPPPARAAAAPKAEPKAAPKPATQASTGKSRLQVDALEPAPAPQVGLKTASQLTLPATEDPARRAAAAAQWSAANADPDAAGRESQRMKELEATLTALKEQTAQNQRTLLEMQSQLAEARESRYRNPLVYSLIALLLVALIVMLFLWRMARRAAEAAWWRDGVGPRGVPQGGPGLDGGPSDEDLFKGSPALRNSSTFAAASASGFEPGVDSGFNDPDEVLPLRAQDSVPARPVNTEELFDVQQQSDFFLSLGQHDQAIAVLREHIVANPGTSALAYLDLLRIFHSLERREDYKLLAEEFERAFNAAVPAFDHFNESAGKGLEHYRSALARIESQWPAPGTLALIEELVFRVPGASEEEAFDLAAYQELLLLYSVAKEVIDPDRAPPAPVTPQSFVDTITHDQAVTAPAPLGVESPPAAIEGGPELAPSIYGAIDASLGRETVLGTDLSTLATAPSRSPTRVDVDLAQFDSTAYETLPAPLEPSEAAPTPTSDPHVIDFELFDPDTEADIAPRPTKR